MPKTKISEFSATPGNNTDIDGINLAEGCAPSGINDAIRELMAQLKDFQAGTAGDSFNGPVGTTTAAAGAFTTLTTSSTVTHNGGTANGVAYLNGSKVLTTGSALTFDGTNLATTGKIGAGGNPGTYTQIWSSGNVMAADGSQIGFLANSAGAPANYMTGSNTSNYLAWIANNAEQMRLTSTGLGIGTSSPQYKLDVAATSAGSPITSMTRNEDNTNAASNALVRIRTGGSSGGDPFLLFTIDAQVDYSIGLDNSASDALVFSRSATLGTNNQMVLDSSGNLGIGTSSPGEKLAVNGSIGLQRSGTQYWHYGVNASNALVFTRSAVADRLTLDSDGNLGLGVTPSASAGAKAINIGSIGYVFGDGSIYKYNAGITSNAYVNGNGTFAAIQSRGAGVFEIDDGVFKWRQASSGTAGSTLSLTQAMTLDTSGNLGVGTTSPAVRLHVDSSGGGIVRVTRLASSAGAYGQLEHDGTNTTLTSSAATIFNAGGATERARITSGGDLLVGTTSATGKVTVSTSGNTYGVYSENTNTASTSNYLFWGYGNAASRFIVYGNGGIANYQANDVNLSDRREKTNFAPAKSYIDAICAIPVQTFNYVDQNMEEEPGLTLGVVAQDVQAVAPELVMESNWAKEGEAPKMRLSIYQTDLQYALMKCIQEQQVMINELKAKVAALEAK